MFTSYIKAVCFKRGYISTFTSFHQITNNKNLEISPKLILIMKSAIIALAIVGVVAALPQRGDQDTTVTRSEFENNGETFNWVSELSDGFIHQQSGSLKQIGNEQGIVITGSYSYTAPDGQLIKVDYVADENGFQPVGAHIPLPGQGAPLPVRAARPAAYQTRAPAKRTG